MESLRDKPEELFRSQFPEKFLKAIAESMIKAYAESYHYCTDNYDKAQCHDLLPHHRRVTIERYLLACTKRFPQATALSMPNNCRNCYHVLIKCGHGVLTVSAVNSPSQMVREAIFRKQYARSIQQNLWPELDPLPELSENLYGVLLHGPDPQNPKQPGFMVIQFPDSDLKSYLSGSIDLVHMLTDKHAEAFRKPKVAKKKIKKEKED